MKNNNHPQAAVVECGAGGSPLSPWSNAFSPLAAPQLRSIPPPNRTRPPRRVVPQPRTAELLLHRSEAVCLAR